MRHSLPLLFVACAIAASPPGGRVLFVLKVAVSLLRRTSARPKLLIRRAAQHSARPEIGKSRGS